MLNILVQFANVIKGVLTAFDRVVFRGRIMPLNNDAGASAYACKAGVLFKDWKEYSAGVTKEIIESAEKMCAEQGRPFINMDTREERDRLALLHEKKEARAKKCMEESPPADGCELICVISATGPGKAFKLKGRGTGTLGLGLSNGRCKHLYYYFKHKKYGFMYAKIMTWLPFTMEIYINGREALKGGFEKAGISYETYDNCFTDIPDVEKAQGLADAFAKEGHSAGFEKLAEMANPFYGTAKKQAGEGHGWFVQQCEAAADIMFVDSDALKNIYSSIIEFALGCFSCKDAFRFLGKKSANGCKGEARPGLKERPGGIRWKAWMKSNSIKVYDKLSVLRVETTINHAKEFKEKKAAFDSAGEFVKWRWIPLKKGIASLPRCLEVGGACNKRLIGGLDGAIPRGEAIKEIEKVSRRIVVDGRSVAGLNVMEAGMYSVLKLVASEDYAVQGFRNKDIAPKAFKDVGDERKRSAKTGRLIRKLRGHGLLSKVSRSSRHLVSKKGRVVISALVQVKETMYPMAVEQAKLMAAK